MENEVDAEPSLRASSGIPDVGVLTRRPASGATAAGLSRAIAILMDVTVLWA